MWRAAHAKAPHGHWKDDDLARRLAPQSFRCALCLKRTHPGDFVIMDNLGSYKASRSDGLSVRPAPSSCFCHLIHPT